MSEIVRWSLLIFFSSFYPTVVTASENKVFLLLVDGLRYDAVSGSQLPGFRSLEKRGVWVERLIPNFPSVGYPNYFSLLTGKWLCHCGKWRLMRWKVALLIGLFPEYHGVTDDNMYDYETNSFLVKGMTSGGDRNGTKWLTTDETFPQTASKHVRIAWLTQLIKAKKQSSFLIYNLNRTKIVFSLIGLDAKWLMKILQIIDVGAKEMKLVEINRSTVWRWKLKKNLQVWPDWQFKCVGASKRL